MKNIFKQMSIRKKQAYAALCMANFCAANCMFDTRIKELIEHLLSILIKDNLAEWENAGSKLAVAGRGDPLPDNVVASIPRNKREAFFHLLECVVEVGIVDMYGSLSEKPLEFLLDCVEIVQSHGVTIPPINQIFDIKDIENCADKGWGKSISMIEYERVMAAYKRIMG